MQWLERKKTCSSFIFCHELAEKYLQNKQPFKCCANWLHSFFPGFFHFIPISHHGIPFLRSTCNTMNYLVILWTVTISCDITFVMDCILNQFKLIPITANLLHSHPILIIPSYQATHILQYRVPGHNYNVYGIPNSFTTLLNFKYQDKCNCS